MRITVKPTPSDFPCQVALKSILCVLCLLTTNAYNFKHSDHTCFTCKPPPFFNLRLSLFQNILKSVLRSIEVFQTTYYTQQGTGCSPSRQARREVLSQDKLFRGSLWGKKKTCLNAFSLINEEEGAVSRVGVCGRRCGLFLFRKRAEVRDSQGSFLQERKKILQICFLSWLSLYKSLFYFCRYVPNER